MGCASRSAETLGPAVAPAPPAVAGTARADVAGATSLAVVPVRVTYVLRALVPPLDSVFPARDSLAAARCANAVGLVCHQYVYRREPFRLRGEGNRLSIEADLSYRARLGVAGGARVASCGYAPQAMRRASLRMTTALYWRRDWRLGAQDTKLSAVLRDPCVVTLFGVDATSTLQALIDRQLAAFAVQADSTIPVVGDFRPLADSLWQSFLEPAPLDSTGTLWLLLEPESVHVTPFEGAGGNLATTLILYARPRVVAGARPPVRRRPLPPLALGQAPPAFVVPVSVELPFDELARRATALLAEETANEKVKVDSVVVRGAGDSVFVDLAVSGALRGRLGMTSRLRWDGTTRELRLDDLAWTLRSQGALARAKATLAAPLVGRAIRRATNGGRISLGAQLDSVRAELLVKLNGPLAPGIMMGSSVHAVQITDVTATARAFVVRALLTGQGGVWVQ